MNEWITTSENTILSWNEWHRNAQEITHSLHNVDPDPHKDYCSSSGPPKAIVLHTLTIQQKANNQHSIHKQKQSNTTSSLSHMMHNQLIDSVFTTSVLMISLLLIWGALFIQEDGAPTLNRVELHLDSCYNQFLFLEKHIYVFWKMRFFNKSV